MTRSPALDLLYVRSLFRPTDFGGNRYPWEVTRRLAARGNAVRVVTPRPGGPLPAPTEARIVPYPVSRRTPLETFATNALFSRLAVNACLRRRPTDVIVLSSYEVAFGHFFARRRKVPTVYIYHSAFRSDAVQRVVAIAGQRKRLAAPLQRFVRFVEDLTYRSADAIVAVSPFSKAEIEAKIGPNRKIQVIPTGVDVDQFRPGDTQSLRRELGLAPDARVLIVVGRLSEVKRYDRAIEALALLRAEDRRYVLMIVGDGPQRERLKQCAQHQGVSDAVRFEGFRDGHELVARLAASDIQLCTSEFENWSLSLLEGLATGVPVVGVPRGGIPQMLRLVDDRLITAEVEAQSIASQVKLCIEPELRDDISRRAREVAVREFAWDSVVARIELLLHEVAAK